MVIGYLHWQLWVGPKWLLELFWTLQQALWKFFSIPVMLITLLSPWHQDRVSLQQGSISGMLKAVAWNSISRVVGMAVRLVVIIAWVISELLLVVTSVATFVFFVLWPIIVAYGIAAGLRLLLTL
ncbi:hypothetical protein CL628_01890 [bacterium]|nr:hypothetical protein [bacterium]